MDNINKKRKFTQFLAPGTGQNRECSPGTDPKIPGKYFPSHMIYVFQTLNGRSVSTSDPLLQILNNFLTLLNFK